MYQDATQTGRAETKRNETMIMMEYRLSFLIH